MLLRQPTEFDPESFYGEDSASALDDTLGGIEDGDPEEGDVFEMAGFVADIGASAEPEPMSLDPDVSAAYEAYKAEREPVPGVIPEPADDPERVAHALAMADDLRGLFEEADRKRARAKLAGLPGYDSEGQPTAPPPEVDVDGLGSDAILALADELVGKRSPVPAGYTPSEWRAVLRMAGAL